MSRIIEEIRLIGFWSWIRYTLRLDDISRWFKQIYYCHHNARVIQDFEGRMSDVIWEATGGMMSKPYYTLEAMRSQITSAREDTYNEGYEDGRSDALEEFGVTDSPRQHQPVDHPSKSD